MIRLASLLALAVLETAPVAAQGSPELRDLAPLPPLRPAGLGAVRPSVAVAATVVRVVDGDTVRVDVPLWAGTPFEVVSVRISGIDSAETRRPAAKCAAEVALGRAAKAYAQTLAGPGDPVQVLYRGVDKYGGRVDASVTLADGRDWAATMLAAGRARVYDGGRKSSWCGGAP